MFTTSFWTSNNGVKYFFQETHMLIVPTYDQFYCVFKSRSYKKQGQLQFWANFDT